MTTIQWFLIAIFTCPIWFTIGCAAIYGVWLIITGWYTTASLEVAENRWYGNKRVSVSPLKEFLLVLSIRKKTVTIVLVIVSLVIWFLV